jgi:hypothetical protein
MTFGIRQPARTATLAACLALLLGMGCAGVGLGGGNRVVDGLKQALSIGTQNAVTQTSQLGGYLDDPAIRIKLPGALDTMATGLRMVGYGSQVDELYVGMNRAAEKAAGEAADVFLLGIRQMTFSDAMGILNGGDTAATEYFERTTRGTLFQRFEPIVTQKMGAVGVVQDYDQLVSRYTALPFTKKPNLDLQDYVTNQALDGLFTVLGDEEQKIRTDAAARVTPLLREVFGK